MTRDSDSPGTEFKVAIGGPVVTLAIALACVGIGIAAAGSDEFWRAMRVDEGADTSGILAVVAWLASINLLVLVFNLIPAFPLDGGRIARAIAWRVSGDRNRATRAAGRLGQALLLPVHRHRHPAVHRGRRGRRDLAGADRLHPRAVGPGRRRADRVREQDRGHQGRGRDGRGAGRDPGGRQRRARPRRVLPALSLALVPGRGRGAALPRPDRARRGRRGPGGEPLLLGGARRLRGGFHRHAAGARRRAPRVAARQRRPAPARRADGGGRRRPPAGRDHGRPGGPSASQRPRRRGPAGTPPHHRINSSCRSTTYW